MKLVVALLLAVAPLRASADSAITPYLYLNRCTNGCVIHGGFDDARAMSSSIPCAGTTTCGNGGCSCNSTSAGDYTIDEFKDTNGNTGAAADAEWSAIVKCVQEVYSPYAITVSDQAPPAGGSRSMAIVAGYPHNIGYRDTDIGGIAPGALGCGPQDNIISYSFANTYVGPQDHRILMLCYVASQESAHAFGIPDHTFNFLDGQSGCIDPMSYRLDCGGQRFFRNKLANCGEAGVRPCRCPNQNSHMRLLSVFGPGTPTTRPPSVRIDTPANDAMVNNGAVIFATASAQRGIFRNELWLNGYKWATGKGAAWGFDGQPESQYPLMFPATVPDGVIDVVVKSFDDLEAEAEATITVTKGAPCTSASTCLTGQRCDAGKCFWDPPTGKVGDACTYDQFCESDDCLETIDQGTYCSQDCVVGSTDTCPMGFTCEGETGGTGQCVRQDTGGGCCSVGDDGKSAALLAVVVGGVLRRRRRRRR